MPFVLDASVAMAWCFEDETTGDTEAVLDRLTKDPAVVPSLWSRNAGDDLLAAGRRHELSAYDAAYLVLAARDGIPLATQDEKLQAAATSAGVPLLIDHS